ncbi:hypothetical protein BST81_24275 [Leptolyngbya sp. 'hensonii']|uniref:WG repeat-containing protein n=1 Tax=Leptolyngbya sp. 'hensonii' TaxID=1922337 RepID=UPI00094FA1A0|nr:WG repeat-containing protein [Leptolyngbya sp. 'hensonii']OLP15838.1 hypothetical protein BST81_24275 [Leptolyngbya sp. 'hensonii']
MLVGGRYEMIRELGRGGFGRTYLAEDTYRRGNPKCVVKKLQTKTKEPALLQAARQLFDQETKALYALSFHDQLPKLFAHFEQNGEFYLVQELIDGHDLRKNLTLGMKLEEDKAIELLREILEILAPVHQQNIIHQDIKPDNLLRRWKDKQLVLIDFGGVKAIRNLVLNAQGQAVVSRLANPSGYMPPEQLEGLPRPCSDVYAIGMMGIQSVTGLSPTQLPRDPDTKELSWHDQASVSLELANILKKMVRYDWEQRYQSVVDVLEDLPAAAPHITVSIDNFLAEFHKPNYRVVIEPKFDQACNFSEGLAGVAIDRRLHFINRMGVVVVRTDFEFSSVSQFRGAYQFSEGLARLEQNHRWGYIDRFGQIVIMPQFDDAQNFVDGLARVELNHAYGYIDATGKYLVKPQFESAASVFSEGLAGVEIDHRYGYIDKTGRLVIQPQFDSADNFVEGLARVTQEDKYGFIDKSGKYVIKPQFDVAHTFREGLARVRIDGKYGYIDHKGEVVIQPVFDDTFSFSHGLALVRSGHKYGFIDRTGNAVIRLQFDDAYPFSHGLAAVKIINKWGYIDPKGDYLLDLQFDDATSFADGLAVIKLNDQWGYVGD